jgi:glycine/D-amino acid oxidase-like deaminating enzyme
VSSAVVVGAGVFGAALADRLVADGWEVTLVDRWEPGDERSESGGETRLLRYSHGTDALYAELAWRARAHWRELDVLEERGVVWLVRREGGWESDGETMLREQGIPVERVDPAGLFPSLATEDLAYGLLEPAAGVLRAGDGVRALVERARSGGLQVVRGEARPERDRVVVGGERAPGGGPGAAGERHLEADHVIWACGGWLAALFPDAVQLRVTRQQVALFDAPPEWSSAPGWIDFDSSFYGHGLIEPYGMKVASDREGEPVEPGVRTRGDLAAAADYLGARFPRLAGARVRSAPACHYSLTADGNFLFGRHAGVWLLGGGSGHGYKHGPAVAEHAVEVLAGRAPPEPRFALGERAPSRALRTAGS